MLRFARRVRASGLAGGGADLKMRERKIEYQTLNQKADVGFYVTAPSLERLYIDAALALTDLRVKLDQIKEETKRTIAVEADAKDALLRIWLGACLTLFDKEKFLPKRILFTRFDGKKIEATLHGEIYAPLRHGTGGSFRKVSEKEFELGEKALPEPHFFARVFVES